MNQINTIATSVDVDSLSRRQSALLIPLTAAAMAVGGLISGVMIALVGQLARLVPTAVTAVPAVCVCVWALAVDISAGTPPTSHWQVPRNYRLAWPVYHAIFGVILGLGWVTVVPFASYYALVAILIALGNAKLTILAMGVFGLMRSVPLVLMSRGILQSGCVADAGKRARERRSVLYRIAEARVMWLLRLFGEIAAVVLLIRRS